MGLFVGENPLVPYHGNKNYDTTLCVLSNYRSHLDEFTGKSYFRTLRHKIQVVRQYTNEEEVRN